MCSARTSWATPSRPSNPSPVPPTRTRAGSRSRQSWMRTKNMTENNQLIRSTAAALADKLAAGEVSAVEVTQAHLDRIAAVDGKVHAFLHVNTDEALAVAAEVDAVRAAGGAAAEELHALAGVPIAVKDLIVTV